MQSISKATYVLTATFSAVILLTLGCQNKISNPVVDPGLLALEGKLFFLVDSSPLGAPPAPGHYPTSVFFETEKSYPCGNWKVSYSVKQIGDFSMRITVLGIDNRGGCFTVVGPARGFPSFDLTSKKFTLLISYLNWTDTYQVEIFDSGYQVTKIQSNFTESRN